MKPQARIEHSAQISNRRRALFPSADPIDPGLDSIKPLNFDSDESCVDAAKKSFTLESVEGYDIIGLVHKGSTVIHTPNNTFVGSQPETKTPVNNDESPTQKLKTPHDLPDNTKFPKLVRNKTHVDTTLNPDKNPRVRTALFPELTMSLPSRTFYPKSNEASPRGFEVRKSVKLRRVKKKQALYLCNRKSRYRCGQINAGVRHKIRKRSTRNKLNNLAHLQAAINIIENSPLNEFLNETRPQTPPPVPPPKDPTPSPEPDPSKKFFKSSRHKAIITVHSNIKIEMNNGRMNLMSNKNPLKRPRGAHAHGAKRAKIEFDSEQPLVPDAVERNISSIISSLEEEDTTKENVLMSPTSQMCNMTSGLALNSPKKMKDLTGVLESLPEEPLKLFPVFYPRKGVLQSKNEKVVKNPAKKFRGLAKDQMLLDAGQKRWGVTQCPECRVVYNMGDPSDEVMHLNYHNAGHIFRFNGWKNERLVSNSFLDGKIIQIVPGDPKIWFKKVKEVMGVINRDLGFYEVDSNAPNSQIFFYIKNRTIIGALVAEVKRTGHKLLTTPQDQVDLCSEESYPIKCGVSRVWVAQIHRKRGVGSAMVDALKRNFMMGYILKNEDIAFSSPTEVGKLFGQRYFQTPNFLIYFV